MLMDHSDLSVVLFSLNSSMKKENHSKSYNIEAHPDEREGLQGQFAPGPGSSKGHKMRKFGLPRIEI